MPSINIILSLLIIPVAQSFSPATRLFAPRNVVSLEASSRREALGSTFGAFLAAGAAVALSPTPAMAGYLNKDSLPEVLAPNPSAVDRDVLKSGKVQDALKDVNFFLGVVKEMEKQIAANPQIDLGPGIVKYFPFAKIRCALNDVNTALDEDTQRGTDRLVRATLQDITELEVANKLKPGISRSDRKVAIMTGKLEKLDKSFSEFLKFFE